ncbi:MAG: C69 family dipeptidase [Bacteroidales bacterium]|jgi:dipeptidase
MKKYFIISVFTGLLAISDNAGACTNFLVTKGATVDGSAMISYTADSHVLYGELYYKPARDYKPGSMLDIYEWDTGKYLGKIKQVAHTYSVIGNMNEHQVMIGETTYGGHEELVDTTAIMDYGSLIYIALQRARTARQAIKIISELTTEYGYCSEGESFSIADPNEVWIMEMIGKGVGNKGIVWVAMRIPDGYVSGHANQARITTFPLNDTLNCLYSKDVISLAREKKYFSGKDEEFSFSDVYAPLNFGAARACEARVWSIFRRINKDMDVYLDYAKGENLKHRMPLWIKPDKKLSVHDVMELMRDHFENTLLEFSKDIGAGPYECPYRWRPMSWKIDSVKYFNERSISTQQTGFYYITQARGWLPDPIGGINWFGVDDAYCSVFTPMYCGITKVPESLREGNGSMMEFSETSAFWLYNQVSNFVYTRYKDMIPELKKVQAELENKYIDNTANVDKEASKFYKTNKAEAIKYLTNYSLAQGANTFNRWKELYHYLFTKYMDGNVKTKDTTSKKVNYKHVNPKVKQPGYGDEWNRRVARETGDRFKTIEQPKK